MVDLADLIEFLQREVNAPGISQLPNAVDDDYLGNLRDGFWEAVLDGVISGYDEDEGIVSPVDTEGDDLTRELQQLVVFYAGYRIVRNQLRDMKTVFRTKAGPVEYEVQQAATVLKAILDDLTYKRNYLLGRLSDSGQTSTHIIDAIVNRSDQQYYGDSWFVR